MSAGIASGLAAHAGLERFDPTIHPPNGRDAWRLAPNTCRSLGVAPVCLDGEGRLVVACTRPPDRAALAFIEAAACADGVHLVLVTAEELARLQQPSPHSAEPATPPSREDDPSGSITHQRAWAARVAEAAGLPHIIPSRFDPAVLLSTTCTLLGVLPIEVEEGELLLGMCTPHDNDAVDLVELVTGLRVRRAVIARCDVERLVRTLPDPAMVPIRPLAGLAQVNPPERASAAATGGEPTTSAPAQQLVVTGRLGEVLLQLGHIGGQELRHALEVQHRTGDRLGHLLVHLGIASAQQVAEAVALQNQVPLARPEDLHQSSQVRDLVPEAICRRHNVLPLAIDRHRLRIAMVDPGDADAHEAVARFTRLPLDPIVVTEVKLIELLRELHREQQTGISVYGLLNRRPEESAHRVLNDWQKVAFPALFVALVVIAIWNPLGTLITLSALALTFYTGFSAFKLWAVIASLDHQPLLAVTPEEAAAIPDRDLPVYTVLVPLYKETQVLPRLVKGLSNLDYPTSKLDVKLLLEEDDRETVAAAYAMGLPAFIDIVVTPDSHPKTKPKSCNYGLLYARGKYACIFDAEDVPERDQLRKAVAAFAKAPAKVVCLQGQLNYYNRNQNMLTKWFTGEYSGWFDMFVPGLDNLNMPIPLGGTSNHFITDVLIELGAWDPFNVTEDADLGIRLFNAGYKTASLNSTTFEEANSETFNWIRQRSRWVKGYIQTWLVHFRDPLRTARTMGWRNFMGFQLVIGGTAFVFLLNPLNWAILLLWVLTQANIIRELLPGSLYYMSGIAFLFGNFVFVYINSLAVIRRRYWDLLWSTMISPLYWALMSIAAWRGLIQLITAPSYWEKTEHGLDDGAFDAAVGGQSGESPH